MPCFSIYSKNYANLFVKTLFKQLTTFYYNDKLCKSITYNYQFNLKDLMTVSATHKKEIGNAIQIKRKSIGLSQRKLALSVEITNVSLSDIENGIIFPSEAVFKKLVDILFANDKSEKDSLMQLYGKAKGLPPLDITEFLNQNPEAVDLLRTILSKNLSGEKITEIKKHL